MRRANHDANIGVILQVFGSPSGTDDYSGKQTGGPKEQPVASILVDRLVPDRLVDLLLRDIKIE